ncbi:hypothetical protein M8A51_25695 [Schlegelella sp. S2-27]|uniref:Uncharacterized protein n=1 Tax=Caldimonas mangrovi TaxID=2944811 RepID=A0ABT0YVZ9_9BURK|nr:hypothetical protein [Caldimonas mangrovi]MCM5682931.1 hypothetical protein [Caldimonas mangrovi]
MSIDVLFSVNEYDRDGDLVTRGIFLHFGRTTLRVADSLSDFDGFIEQLRSIRAEIDENHQGALS